MNSLVPYMMKPDKSKLRLFVDHLVDMIVKVS